MTAAASTGPTVIPAFDLTTTYLGLHLRSPLVASSGPLTARIDSLRALEQAGIAAVVLPSLFEEQIEHEDMQAARLGDLGADSNPEATSYFPDLAAYESVVDRYLRHVEEAKKALSIPVVASLNGETAGGWVRYARLLELAGADVAMKTSALLKNGPGHVATVERELVAWAVESGFESVAQFRGSVSQRHVADPSAFERANYMATLTGFTSSFH